MYLGDITKFFIGTRFINNFSPPPGLIPSFFIDGQVSFNDHFQHFLQMRCNNFIRSKFQLGLLFFSATRVCGWRIKIPILKKQKQEGNFNECREGGCLCEGGSSFVNNLFLPLKKQHEQPTTWNRTGALRLRNHHTIDQPLKEEWSSNSHRLLRQISRDSSLVWSRRDVNNRIQTNHVFTALTRYGTRVQFQHWLYDSLVSLSFPMFPRLSQNLILSLVFVTPSN